MVVARCTPKTLIAGLLLVLPGTVLGGEVEDGHVMTERMMLLAIQVGLILFCAQLANRLFERLRLPGALGEVAIGTIIGPFALGALVFYGFPEGVFPAYPAGGISPELNGLATIASIVLLFMVGLETDLKLLLRYSVAGGVTGLGGLVASFIAGSGAVVLFSRLLYDTPLAWTSAPALMLGTITTATSVGITARILAEKRKLDTPEGVTMISAAVIDDVIGIIILAVVTSFIGASQGGEGVDWGHIAVIAIKALGVWLGATVIGLAAARRISLLLKLFRDRTTIAILALGLALILAGLFEEAGLAMIIGAYVMGLALSQSDINHVIQDKLSTISALLVPIFFCVTGMRIDLCALLQPSVLLFGGTYALLALASKVLGCGLPALLVGFNLRGAARIGFGMAPRCEVALIIAGIGIANGLLAPQGGSGGEQILAAVIIMILVNTVVAPPALVSLFANPAPGVRHEKPDTRQAREVSFDFPTIEMASFFISKLTRLLEDEGFFAHCLDRRHHLFQLRKDRAIIDFHRQGTELHFRCQQRELPLVDAVMYECLAALEQTLRGLRSPLDATTIQTRLQEHGSNINNDTFCLHDYLDIRHMIVDLKATDKEGVLTELMATLARSRHVINHDQALAAVREREASLSTGLQHGVAVPHARTDAVTGLVCAIGVSRNGVDFKALDGKPSRIFVLILSPETRPAPQLQMMSTISRLLDENGRRQVLAAQDAGALYACFCPTPAPSGFLRHRSPRPEQAAATTPFDPCRYLDPDCIILDLASDTKEGVIRELIARLAAQDLIHNVAAAEQAVLDRESQVSTGLMAGVALPHGRCSTVDGLVCAIGVARNGLDFGALDQQATRFVVLVLTPPAGADPYLQFVAWAVGALGPQRQQALLECRDASQFCRTLLDEASEQVRPDAPHA